MSIGMMNAPCCSPWTSKVYIRRQLLKHATALVAAQSTACATTLLPAKKSATEGGLPTPSAPASCSSSQTAVWFAFASMGQEGIARTKNRCTLTVHGASQPLSTIRTHLSVHGPLRRRLTRNGRKRRCLITDDINFYQIFETLLSDIFDKN